MNPVNNISETYYTYTDVTSGEWYDFKVRALSSITGWSDFTDTLGIQAATTPSAPTGLYTRESSNVANGPWLAFIVSDDDEAYINDKDAQIMTHNGVYERLDEP